jgi:hypothetical protein
MNIYEESEIWSSQCRCFLNDLRYKYIGGIKRGHMGYASKSSSEPGMKLILFTKHRQALFHLRIMLLTLQE